MVTADNIHLSQNTNIKTDTQGAAPAGNIVVAANTLLADDASQISSSSSAAGPGGNISINTGQSVSLNSGSSISASSTGSGNQFSMTNSSVTTEANQSGGGIIKITTNPNGTVQLTDGMISASVLDGA